jgi:hypothetical protein
MKFRILRFNQNLIFSFALLILFLLSACSTKTSYNPISENIKVDPGSVFSVGEIKDDSGFVFPPDEEDTLILTDSMKDALVQALKTNNVFGDDQFVITVKILSYSPGNAFHRWLLPGAGATKLKVEATILNQEGVAAASIPVERSIAAGGGFTIGAWKYVFVEVAEAIVDILTDPGKRNTP